MEDILKKSNIINGLFITFEGIDGSGKSSQIIKLKKKLLSYNIKKVIFTREPGGTKFGEKVREILLAKNHLYNLTSETQLLLLLAARKEHYEKLIKPFLLKKYIVICDRFIDSTYAYQCTDNIKLKNLYTKLNKLIIGNFSPDLTILLDISPALALERMKSRKHSNKFDKLSEIFFIKIREAYLKQANKHKRIKVIDASRSRNNVHTDILATVLNKIKF